MVHICRHICRGDADRKIVSTALVIHAWSGYDYTSSIFGKGKVTFMNMVQKSENLQSTSEVMCDY